MEKQCWCCLYYTVKGLSDLARNLLTGLPQAALFTRPRLGFQPAFFLLPQRPLPCAA